MLTVSLPPHTWGKASVRRWYAGSSLSLLPLCLAGSYCWQFRFLLTMAGAICVALGSLAVLRRGRMSGTEAWRAVRDSCLLALLAPAGASLAWPLLASFLATAARLAFREKDFDPPVNPIAWAAAFIYLPLAAAHPAVNAAPANWLFERGGAYFQSGLAPLAATLLLSALLGRRLFKWPILIAGLAAAGLPMAALAEGFPSAIQAASGYLGFFGLLAAGDQSGTPMTRWGQAWYGTIAGIAMSLFASAGLLYQGVIVATLIGSIATPGLDFLAIRWRRR